MGPLSELPPALRQYLCDQEARARRMAVIRAVGVSVFILLLWTLGACAADRFFHLTSFWRVTLLGAAIVLGALILGRTFLALPRRMDWLAAAERVERHNPRFGQSLVTVISRLVGPTAHRGSEEILSHLLHDLEYKVRDHRERKGLPPARVAMPWLACLLLAAATVALAQVPGFGLGRLMRRFVEPLAELPPVTTTQIQVTPGDQDLMQSATLHLDAQAQDLGGQPLWVFRNVDGSWVRSAMNPVAPGQFAFSLSGVDRDVRYYVQGGDAQTRHYLVRVLRRPAVDQFKIRYVFPSYTARSAMNVTNTDGLIEAPAGTHATVFVYSSEPLQSALLTIGGEKLLMQRTADEQVRSIEFVVRKDAHCELDLISNREVAGSGPPTMQVRAMPDRPPVVRLAQAAQNVRLNPRDIIPLSYDVVDDFGIAALTVRVQVNALPLVETTVPPIGSDHRRQEGVVDVDLASRKLEIGDVVSIWLAASDTSAQLSVSDPMHVLISPRSIDSETHQRIAELQSAVQFVAMLNDEWQAADKGLEEADAGRDRPTPASAQASARAHRRLTSASEDATLLRQALYRATLHSHSPELSQGLAGWIDTAQVSSDTADELFRRAGSTPAVPATGAPAATPPRERLRQAMERSRRIQEQLLVVVQGQQAEAVLADRENLLASEHKAPPAGSPGLERFRETLARAREDMFAGARELGIDPGAADLEGRLKAKVESAASLLRSLNPVDYAAAAHEWSQDVQRSPQRHATLEDRLSAAAEAEAIRPDADLARARDLQLASRAAASIESIVAAQSAGRPAPAGLSNEFAAAVAALQREHDVRQRAQPHSPEELSVIKTAAAKAREQLAAWAPDVEDPAALTLAVASARPAGGGSGSAVAAARAGPARPSPTAQSVEELALQASAAAAARDYAKSAALDKAMIKRLAEAQSPGASTQPVKPAGGTAPAAVAQARVAERQVDERIIKRVERQTAQVAQSMETAKRIDGLGNSQDALARQTDAAKSSVPPQVVGRQREVADEIARVAGHGSTPDPASDGEDPNWRGRATETLLSVQAELAAMPQQLAELRQASITAHEADMRAAAARQTVGSAPPDQKTAAERAARQATQDAQDAAGRLDRVLRPVSREAADAIAGRLAPFAPETSTAHDAVGQQLGVALGALSSAAKSGDDGAATRAAAEARTAIEAAQRELARAQDAFTERDPLSAAKWFARAAADSLSRQPPDVRGAQTHQARVGVALSRAWDRSIHEAAARRLAAVPSLQSVYAPNATPSAPRLAGGSSAPGFAAAREWGRLRPRGDDDAVNLVLHESDPAGYEESLKLYFEALGKAQEGKGN